jgi:hypothetical protein
MLRIDHVIYGVHDLDAAGRRLFERFGLASAPGGKHEGWGTANAIVPLGDTYVELVAVIDPEKASRSVFGRWLEVGVMERDRLMGWSLATDNLDREASRLELTISRGSRKRPDGSVVSWRTAGLEESFADQSLPFFIEWDGPASAHPGRTQVEHRVAPTGIAWIDVVAPSARLREWTDGAKLPLRVQEHEAPRLRAVGISTEEGDVVLR